MGYSNQPQKLPIQHEALAMSSAFVATGHQKILEFIPTISAGVDFGYADADTKGNRRSSSAGWLA